MEPAWGPNGMWVAFASNRSGNTDIYAYELATGTNVRLTDRPDTDGRPAWLDDGRLVYVAWTSGTPQLRWLDPDEPGVTHEIDIGPGEPDNPSGVAREGKPASAVHGVDTYEVDRRPQLLGQRREPG